MGLDIVVSSIYQADRREVRVGYGLEIAPDPGQRLNVGLLTQEGGHAGHSCHRDGVVDGDGAAMFRPIAFRLLGSHKAVRELLGQFTPVGLVQPAASQIHRHGI